MTILSNVIISRFSSWFEEAKAHPDINEPTAFTLATATSSSIPSARIVLLKQFSEDGFVFYTNYGGRKSMELAKNPHAAMCFYWMPMEKQVRIEGRVEKAPDTMSDAYFATRERGKQIGAWASNQSQPLESMEILQARVSEVEQRFAGQNISRPPHWGGWILRPTCIEFWQQGASRLHEREVFVWSGEDWQEGLLYP